MSLDYLTHSRRNFLSFGAAALGLATLSWPRAVAATPYREIAVSDGASLEGFVTFAGAPPAADEILISKDHAHCGEGVVIPDPVRLGDGGRLSHAVVTLEAVPEGKPWPAEFTAPKILQARCKFEPYVQLAPKGAELTITNEDPLLHNIHAYELIGRARRTLFNIAQPAAGQIDRHALKLRRGDVVEIDCDAHNWMSAWIYTSGHPYVSLADPELGYAIDGIPPGAYRLVAWHPVFGEVSREVTLAPGETLELQVEFTADDARG